MNFIEFESVRTIQRPVNEVVSQFSDMVYHSVTEVHKGVKFTIHSDTKGKCIYRMEVRVLGMLQTDEITLTCKGNHVRTVVTAGTNPRLIMEYDFKAQSPGVTEILSKVQVPKIGIKRLLAPIFKIGIHQALEKAFEEDRLDLESGNYERYQRSRQSA